MPDPTLVFLSGVLDAGQVGYLVLMLVVFVLLMAAAWFVLRWLAGRGMGGGRSKHMKVLDRLVLTRDSSILILQVSGRVFVVAAGKDSSDVLCELDPSDFPPENSPRRAGAPDGEEPSTQPGFWKRFFHNLRLNMGLLPKGTQPMTPGGASRPPSDPQPDTFQDILRRVQHAQAAQNHPSHSPESGRAASGNLHVEGRAEGAAAGRKEEPVYTRHTRPVYDGEAPKVKADYNEIIDNMRQLGLVDKDRPPPPREQAPAAAAAPQAEPYRAEPPVQPEAEPPQAPDEAPGPAADGQDKYDMMFDLIAKRQARYAGKKDRGKDGP